MIELTDLTKKFDDFTAVSRVTLSVAAGEILALLGPNGAGKTTTVRMVGAILRPTEGRAIVAGYDVATHPREVRRRVGFLTEHPGLYLRMRGREYLEFFGGLMGLEPQETERRAAALLDKLDMREAWDRRMGTYSKGMRQKMALVRALLHDPPVLLLDEPTSAMDPHSARLVREAIFRLRDNRRAIILCTHNLSEAEMLADRIAIIRRGRIVTCGTPAELKRRLLGPPVMELRLACSVDGVLGLVSNMVKVDEYGDQWLRYTTTDPQNTNPPLLQILASHRIPVLTLSEVPRSLEEVYLRVIEEA
ncbi:MAG: ABC transporter ATP-binding protein [Anaerolineae bacterium]|nr:ABC transporter ATP-binding protein [Anaerolineae bacterium]